jgi:hypothetical protein
LERRAKLAQTSEAATEKIKLLKVDVDEQQTEVEKDEEEAERANSELKKAEDELKRVL